jgi:hypothetical protein
MALMRDLGLMEIDSRGLWVDRPIDEILAERMAGCEGGASYDNLPPAASDQMLRDADIDPNAIEYQNDPGALPTPAENSNEPPGAPAVQPEEAPKSTQAPAYGAPTLDRPEPESLGRRMWNSLFHKKTPEAQPVPQMARAPQRRPGPQSAYR